jgi:hypothetical protein
VLWIVLGLIIGAVTLYIRWHWHDARRGELRARGELRDPQLAKMHRDMGRLARGGKDMTRGKQ